MTYNQPVKKIAREAALTHAVTALTHRRAGACCVPVDYVRRVRDHLLRTGTTADVEVASLLDSATILSWERFHASHLGGRRPEDLTVAYLCGPEPLNDFQVLVDLGLHPHNIWAFEEDERSYKAAVEAVRRSHFPMLKIHRAPIEQVLMSAPKKFDIIYLDACGPLPSDSQNTLRMLSCALRHHRLASPGALVTNFACPSVDEPYTRLVASYLYPKDFLEHIHDDGTVGAIEGPVAHGLQLEAEDPTESFMEKVRSAFPEHYGQFITRQILDLASVVVPWLRVIGSEYRKLFFTAKPKEIADAAGAMGDFESKDEELAGMVQSEMGRYPLQWTISALESASEEAAAKSTKRIYQTWVRQMTGLPPPPDGMDAQTAIFCYDALRASRRWDTESFRRAMSVFDAHQHKDFFQFCDVPTETLAFDLLFNQLAYPMHYVTDAIRRWTYVAKVTQMFLDVTILDECRYIYEWLPTADLLELGFDEIGQQLSYRFALDGLAKNRRWYNGEYFFGAAVLDQGTDGFSAKYVAPRLSIAPPATDTG